MSAATWELAFRVQLAAKGYDNPTIHYDPFSGWTVLAEWGGKEIEGLSTVVVRERIAKLPDREKDA